MRRALAVAFLAASLLTGCADQEARDLAEEAYAEAQGAKGRIDELEIENRRLNERVAYLEAETL